MVETLSVTVVVPVYNEATTIHNNILSIYEHIKVFFPAATLLVVDDGSTDGTQKALQSFKAQMDTIKVIQNKLHRGKGYALYTGAREAKSDVVCFLDCDLSIDTKYIETLVHEINNGFDIAIASRFIHGGINEATLTRKCISLIFRTVRRLIIGLPNIADTQCGCKAFKREVLSTTFDKTIIDGFCYDLELLYLMNKAGCTIKEIPIKMYNQEVRRSKVRVFKESYKMLRDLLVIKIHHG